MEGVQYLQAKLFPTCTIAAKGKRIPANHLNLIVKQKSGIHLISLANVVFFSL